MQAEYIAQVPQRKYQQAIADLSESLKDLPQVETPVLHLFSVGYYARVVSIPAGTLAIGKIHKTRNCFSLVRGTIRISTGGDVKEITAPYHGTILAGQQNAVYAVTDCAIMNVHKTNKTTLAEIEDEVIAKTMEDVWHG